MSCGIPALGYQKFPAERNRLAHQAALRLSYRIRTSIGQLGQPGTSRSHHPGMNLAIFGRTHQHEARLT